MKKLTSLIFISIIAITAFAQNIINRDFNDFKLGVTTIDSVRSSLTKADIKFQVSQNEISIAKYWFEKYCFDNVTFTFKSGKLEIIQLTQNCFDLTSSDKFGKDFLETLEKKYGNFENRNGIYTKRDKQTYIRLAQQQNEDRTSIFKVIIVDLVKE